MFEYYYGQQSDQFSSLRHEALLQFEQGIHLVQHDLTMILRQRIVAHGEFGRNLFFGCIPVNAVKLFNGKPQCFADYRDTAEVRTASSRLQAA